MKTHNDDVVEALEIAYLHGWHAAISSSGCTLPGAVIDGAFARGHVDGKAAIEKASMAASRHAKRVVSSRAMAQARRNATCSE